MERARLLLRESAHKQSGFSLLELIVVMTIIGVMATMIIPNLRRRSPDYERKQFISRLEGMVQYAWQRAIEGRKLHRVFVNVKKRTVSIQVKKEKKIGKDEFVPIKSFYLRSTYQWDTNLIIKNFYIDRKDQMALGSEIWFFLMPDGLAQDVVLNMIDRKDTRGARQGRKFSLVLNPFTVQFKEYDAFQKP